MKVLVSGSKKRFVDLFSADQKAILAYSSEDAGSILPTSFFLIKNIGTGIVEFSVAKVGEDYGQGFPLEAGETMRLERLRIIDVWTIADGANRELRILNM